MERELGDGCSGPAVRTARGEGLGARLTAEVLSLAARRGVARVYLLTETAVPYFERVGFRPITWGEAGIGAKTSAEFTGACPSSAQAMVFSI